MQGTFYVVGMGPGDPLFFNDGGAQGLRCSTCCPNRKCVHDVDGGSEKSAVHIADSYMADILCRKDILEEFVRWNLISAFDASFPRIRASVAFTVASSSSKSP